MIGLEQKESKGKKKKELCCCSVLDLGNNHDRLETRTDAINGAVELFGSINYCTGCLRRGGDVVIRER